MASSDPGMLAERFNEASQALAARGHRVVVRRARAALLSGDPEGALAFLGRARDVLGDVPELAAARDELAEFVAEGGDVAELLATPDWAAGVAAEDQLRLATQAAGGSLEALVGVLARQQTALAQGEPLRLPDAEPAARSPAAPSMPIGTIFPEGRRPRAAVEIAEGLQERDLDLDEGLPAGRLEPAFAEPLAPAPPPVEAAAAPEFPEVDVSVPPAPLSAAEPPAVEAPLDPTTPAPPEPVVLAPPGADAARKANKASRIALLVLLVLVLAAAAAVYFAGDRLLGD